MALELTMREIRGSGGWGQQVACTRPKLGFDVAHNRPETAPDPVADDGVADVSTHGVRDAWWNGWFANVGGHRQRPGSVTA